jgi:endogenous inhibitor of DNA gyrase (YacG/DUF329 family)
MSLDEGTMVLFGPCIGCGKQTAWHQDPETIPCVWVHTVTRSPIAPDGHHIVRDEPGTSAEPLCPRCAPIHVAAGKNQSVARMFATTRWDLIDLERAVALQLGEPVPNPRCPECGPGYRYGDDGCRHEMPGGAS